MKGDRCEDCGKNEVVIRLTHVLNNEMTVVGLCESCAAERGVDSTSPQVASPLADFLAQMSGDAVQEAPSALRYPAGSFYLPFKHAFRGVYPTVKVRAPVFPPGLRRALNPDGWLYLPVIGLPLSAATGTRMFSLRSDGITSVFQPHHS